MENKVDRWDHEDLQQQVWELQKELETLHMEITLLRNEIQTIKHEGCALSKDILMRYADDGK